MGPRIKHAEMTMTFAIGLALPLSKIHSATEIPHLWIATRARELGESNRRFLQLDAECECARLSVGSQ